MSAAGSPSLLPVPGSMEKPVRVQNATGSQRNLKKQHIFIFLRRYVSLPCGFVEGQEGTLENATCRFSLLPLSSVLLQSSLHTLGERGPQNYSTKLV